MNKRGTKSRQNKGFLADLVLWRNDPGLAEEICQLAEQGNLDAQYALGLIYAEGRGLEQDEVAAYYWLSMAIQQGDNDAKTLREVVLQSMSLQQIQQARQQVNKSLI